MDSLLWLDPRGPESLNLQRQHPKTNADHAPEKKNLDNGLPCVHHECVALL